mgnify:CR=1 FL=1
MTIKVKLLFTDPNREPAVIHGIEVPFEALTVRDLTDRIAETEAPLSRITGLAVRIETGVDVYEGAK